MGSNSRMPDEGPQRTVKLKAFWIDKYEVTNLQYQQFIEATGHHSPQHFENRTFPKGKIDHPVTYVSWYDAKAYCVWAGKRQQRRPRAFARRHRLGGSAAVTKRPIHFRIPPSY